jgi:hypothetical protein
MTWPALVVVVVALALLALRFLVLTRRPCPVCGHPRSRHGSLMHDGIVTAPQRCRDCGKECTF